MILRIFFSYAHEDEELMNEVRRQLVLFERLKKIEKWHDRVIMPGEDFSNEIDWRLKQARIILLFVSPHFLDSKYCYEVEMKEALCRHEEGTATVIPIILRPCLWQDAPFSHLNALPEDGVAVTLWPNRDLACLHVAEGIMRVVDDIKMKEPFYN